MENEKRTSIEFVTTKLEESKLNEIIGYNNKLNQLISNIGSYHLRMKELEEELDLIMKKIDESEIEFKQTNSELRKVVSELEKVYPKGQINLDNGTVTYKADSKQ